MATIEYFYSAHSAFAYLGSARLMQIAAAAGRGLAHRPIHLAEVVAGAGSSPTRQRTAAHRSYFFGREIARWSELREAPVVSGMPTHHHNDTTLSNCMIVAGVGAGLNVDALAHALLQAHWRDDADLADAQALSQVATTAGYDAQALLSAAHTPQVRAAYADNTREAIERSVFGSPTYFVDGDMFYGQDRLEMVERALARAFS